MLDPVSSTKRLFPCEVSTVMTGIPSTSSKITVVVGLRRPAQRGLESIKAKTTAKVFFVTDPSNPATF
jgi:hypothetical protein